MESTEHNNAAAAVSMQFRAQTYDVDFAGVVSNIVYLRWCEDLRLALLDRLAPGWNREDYGLVPVVAETKIRYRRPVHLYDVLEAECRIMEIDGRFFTVRNEFRREGELTTIADNKCCMVDVKTGKAADLPSAFAGISG